MVRLSWKGLILMSAAAASLAGGGWGYLHAAATVSERPKIGEKAACQIARDAEVRFNGGNVNVARTQGVIEADIGQTYVNSDGLEVTELKVSDTLTQGSIEGIGEVAITWDHKREMPLSSLTANQKESSFPATQVMRFHPVFILNGEIFNTRRGAAPATLVNADVESFPPPKDTEYVLANSLTLVSDKGNTITVRPGRAVTIQ